MKGLSAIRTPSATSLSLADVSSVFVRKDGKEMGEIATVRTFMRIDCSFDSSVGRAEDCRGNA